MFRLAPRCGRSFTLLRLRLHHLRYLRYASLRFSTCYKVPFQPNVVISSFIPSWYMCAQDRIYDRTKELTVLNLRTFIVLTDFVPFSWSVFHTCELWASFFQSCFIVRNYVMSTFVFVYNALIRLLSSVSHFKMFLCKRSHQALEMYA